MNPDRYYDEPDPHDEAAEDEAQTRAENDNDSIRKGEL